MPAERRPWSGAGPSALTTPNLLTASRIVAVPALVAAFYLPGALANWTTLILFVAAAVTDYLDGHLARAHSLHSPLGRMMDPIADKLLVGAALLMLVHVDAAPVIPALVILCRELLVSGLREFLVEIEAALPVSRLAKWKAGVQMTAIAFLLAGEVTPLGALAVDLGTVGLWLAAVITVITGADYLLIALRHALGSGAAQTTGNDQKAAPSTGAGTEP